MNVFPDWLESIAQIEGVQAAFVGRVDGVDVAMDRAEAVLALEPAHAKVADQLGFIWSGSWRAEQVHDNGIANVSPLTTGESQRLIPAVDGLITQTAGDLLAIYVADCGAVYFLDKKTKAIGLVHSGRMGTERQIVARAIEKMQMDFGTSVEDLVVVLAPCIRPPHYEVDFAQGIRAQVMEAGVPESQYHDCGICTAEEVEHYYSYRLEKGKTGRMLALLGIEA